MSKLTRTFYRVALYSGLTAAARIMRPGAPVLCYHNIVQGQVRMTDSALHLDVETFRRQMRWLAEAFTVVSLDELHARASRGRSVRGLAAVTFDDAYQGSLEHGLGVLRELSLPSTVFVPSEPMTSGRSFWWDQEGAAGAASDEAKRERFLETLAGDGDQILGGEARVALAAQCMPASWEQIRALDPALVTIGAHSVTHRTLPRLDDASLAREVSDCATTIQRETGVRPRWFAYPYGRWDLRVAAAVRAAGYQGGWTLGQRDVTSRTDWMGASRINIPRSLGFDSFTGWVSGSSHVRSLLA